MDVTFTCPTCKQELEADASLAGTTIQCPSCSHNITIPTIDPQNVKVINPIASSAAAKEEKHFSVPVHDHPSEVLITKSAPTLEVAAKETDRKIRIKTIRHVDCVEVGHDRYDQIVTEFLQKVGEENIVSLNTVSYTYIDIGSQKLLTDFGLTVVYKG